MGISTPFAKVSDLIDQDTCSWKEPIVRQLFTVEHANRILCMPLSSSSSTDSLIWRFENHGLYSIHSGYYFLINSSPGLAEGSDHRSANRNNSFFNALWKLDVEISCVLCGREMETNEHLVCSCSFTRRLMQELGLIFDMPSSTPDWITWFSQLFKQLPKHKCAIFVTTIWALLYYQNNKVHDHSSQSIKEIASFVMHTILVSHRERTSISGAIVRDTNGYIMAASTFPHSYVSDHEMVEVRACEQAVSLARNLGFRRVIFEGDSLNVISKLKNPANDLSDISVILKNIHDQRSSFHSLSFLQVKRNGNEATHLLAKKGRKFTSKRIWIEEAPTCVEATVISNRWWVDLVA
ncbi:hypothetical protein V6N13_073030 [Hibiscus sabdariffa]|uniref:RNase H type-1 domain-containing protein n=1 Tax=Hibiscus sabdariffa TaxID=183260 RepID=A0ABR2E9X6_9ROSI